MKDSIRSVAVASPPDAHFLHYVACHRIITTGLFTSISFCFNYHSVSLAVLGLTSSHTMMTSQHGANISGDKQSVGCALSTPLVT